ncbi:hypothetical protein [Streptomyces parvulus]|uniref:hypothetical protein n=1 Tax=Streptomyces parvulus TaxID=146923 RepID=UPI0036AA0209
MERSEDQILAEELAALGAVSGGGPLVRAVGRLMRKNVHEIDLHVPLPFGEAVKHVSAVLGRAGRGIDAVPAGSGGGEETVRGVVGGGAGGLNPVVVTARVRRTGVDGSAVHLRAAAKEGLIRQRAGEKTAVRLAALLAGKGESGETGG